MAGSRNQVILSVSYHHSKYLELTSTGISVALKSTRSNSLEL